MLEIVPLESRQVLSSPGEPPKYVYFPRGGFLSSTIVMENGAMVEVATIGREGMAGLATKWPSGPAPTNTLVVVQGDTRRLLPDDGGRLPPRNGRLRRVHGAGHPVRRGVSRGRDAIDRLQRGPWCRAAPGEMAAAGRTTAWRPRSFR